MRLNYGIVSVAIALLLASLDPADLRAEVRLTGTEDHIILRVDNATVPEIVAGMQSILHVKITLIGTTPRQFTGVYVGPLRQVLSRLLNGINYVVSSRPDGMIVAIIGQNTPRSGPVVVDAPSATEKTAAPAVMIAANNSDGAMARGPQGWMPAENPYKAFMPAAPKTLTTGAPINQTQPVDAVADGPENNSGAEGWVPTDPPYKALKPAATAAPAIMVAANDSEGVTSGPQGWMPTENPYKAFIPAAPKTGAPVATIEPARPVGVEVDEPGNDSGAQGWIPTEDPFKHYRPAGTAANPAAKAAPQMPDFGALGSMNALMNDMGDNPAPQGANGRTDLPNRKQRSSKVPPSLAPMLTPAPGLDN
jgi:hypothetical protein